MQHLSNHALRTSYRMAMSTLLRADATPAECDRAGRRKHAIECEQMRRILAEVTGETIDAAIALASKDAAPFTLLTVRRYLPGTDVLDELAARVLKRIQSLEAAGALELRHDENGAYWIDVTRVVRLAAVLGAPAGR